MLSGTIIIPDVKFDQRVWRAHVDLYREWRVAHDIAFPAPPIINIRYVHDPNWRYSFMSIQAARDLTHPGWVAVALLFYVAQASWLLGTFTMATMGWWMG